MAEFDGAQGFEIVVDEEEHLVEAFASIPQHLADLQFGEAVTEVFDTRDGLEVVVAVGGDEGAGQGPEGEQAVVHDVEGLSLVAEVVLAPPSVGVLLLLLPTGGRGVGGRRGLIGAAVVDVGRLRVAGGGEAAVVGAGLGVAGTALPSTSSGQALSASRAAQVRCSRGRKQRGF